MPSTAAIYVDGLIQAATHEERYTRRKNDETFPIESINYCLKEANIHVSDLDAVVIASNIGASYGDMITRKSRWTVSDYLKEQYKRWLPSVRGGHGESQEVIDIFRDKHDFGVMTGMNRLYSLESNKRNKAYQQQRKIALAEFLGIDTSKVSFIEHHRCHAAYSYYASEFRDEKVLGLTIDGSGDGLNATAGIFAEDGSYKRFFSTADCNIGRIYRYMTLLLGMKPNEHEFKVMGLAPYGKLKHAQPALDIFRETLYVDGVEFKWNIKPEDSYFWFKERFEGIRFDNIAYALQTWTEELVCKWVEGCIEKSGVNTVVISGGVAMNIKAMGMVSQLSSVRKLFVGGSASDDSLAVGAAICAAEDKTIKDGLAWDSRHIRGIDSLYLGSSAVYNQADLNEFLGKHSNFEILESPSNKQIAELILNGYILGRCTGKMEFGQRSLGNRSIIADPKNLAIKERINSAIKSRDFWMPFAPVVLDTYSDRYLVNPKSIKSPYMTIGFNTTEEGFHSMMAACHPADRTARAQVLERGMNESLYDLIQAFEGLTGRGALLNTSFNLHGSPIVRTVDDALYVLVNSDLDGLILDNHLITRKNRS